MPSAGPGGGRAPAAPAGGCSRAPRRRRTPGAFRWSWGRSPPRPADPEVAVDIRTLADSPRNQRGNGQVSHLLLTEGQFGSRRLSVTWVECRPGSQQAVHTHPVQEQVYVIVRG